MRILAAPSIDNNRWVLGLKPFKYGTAKTNRNITNMLQDQSCCKCGNAIAYKEIVRFIKDEGMIHLTCCEE